MAETRNHILSEIEDPGIALVTINHPDKLNALNLEVLEELEGLLNELKSDSSVRGVIITGGGGKAFVAGADIAELKSLDSKAGARLSKKGQNVFKLIEILPKPVVAAVNGFALGGGAELAMACHIRLASSKAVFGLPEVSLGLIPGYGGTQRLTQLVGRGIAMEMILSGRQVPADEAASAGLVNRVVSDEDLITEAKELLGKILANGPVAIKKAIRAVNEAGGGQGFEMESKLFGELCDTEDFKEGTAAFIEKRKPTFKGR